MAKSFVCSKTTPKGCQNFPLRRRHRRCRPPIAPPSPTSTSPAPVPMPAHVPPPSEICPAPPAGTLALAAGWNPSSGHHGDLSCAAVHEHPRLPLLRHRADMREELSLGSVSCFEVPHRPPGPPLPHLDILPLLSVSSHCCL